MKDELKQRIWYERDHAIISQSHLNKQVSAITKYKELYLAKIK